jgi:Zn-dependent protease
VAYLTTVATVLLFFASLILHEFGHAVAARRQGIKVTRIELFLFGGLTEMSRDALTPGEDFKVAAAGPLATFLVVLLCLGVDLAIVGPHRLIHAVELDGTVPITPVLLSLSWLVPMNVLILLFNLVPAFPLDGGRIARAAVWRVTGNRLRGMRAAARLGQGFAVLLAGVGIWLMLSYTSFTGLWLLAIALMIGQSARSAALQTAVSERIDEVRVADIMDPQPVSIPSTTAVTAALEEFLLRYGAPWLPVVDPGGRFLGIAHQDRAQTAQDAGEGWLTIDSVLEREDGQVMHVDEDRPLTDVLSLASLGRLGAVMAVDHDGVLRGVLTAEQIRRALQAVFASGLSG